MNHFKISRLFLAILTILVLITGFISWPALTPQAQAADNDNVAGWAWSDNIGWISFNNSSSGDSTTYGVNIDDTTYKLSGYAWSDNIGWISFDRDKTGDPPSDDPCTDGSCIAKLKTDNYQLDGWARALNYGGGWDGWISLGKKTGDSIDYQVSLNTDSKEFEGWAYGSDVLGWISFNHLTDGSSVDYKVYTSLSIGIQATNPHETWDLCADTLHPTLNWSVPKTTTGYDVEIYSDADLNNLVYQYQALDTSATSHHADYDAGTCHDDNDNGFRDPSLVGSWHFDEGSGTTAHDSSGNGNDGTLENGPTWVDGRYGKALSFDGANDYVDYGNSVADFGSAGTVSMWVYANSKGGLFSRSTGTGWSDERYVWHFYSGPTSYLRLTLSDGNNFATYNCGEDFPMNQWVYLTVTHDGSNVKFYQNGVFINSVSQTINPEMTGVKTWIGRVEGLNPNFFNGTIDEVKIYNRALSAEEIQKQYNDEYNNACDLQYKGNYWWRVRVRNVDNVWGQWSSTDDFTVVSTHQWPSPDFSTDPENPQTGSVTHFLDQTTTYGDSTAAKWEWIFSGTEGTDYRYANNNGLVGSWHFDKGSGTTAYDSSGNGNDGTLENGSTWVDGRYGKALSFDGSDDYVDLDTSLLASINNNGTLSFWYYPETETGSPFTISDGTGWADEHLALYGKTGQYILKLCFADDTNYINEIPVDPSMSLNTWAYLTITWTPTTYKTYKNGNLVSSDSKTIIPAISGSTWIGKQQGLWGNFKGPLDEVRIYNRALSAEEIQKQYTDSTGSHSQNPDIIFLTNTPETVTLQTTDSNGYGPCSYSSEVSITSGSVKWKETTPTP